MASLRRKKQWITLFVAAWLAAGFSEAAANTVTTERTETTLLSEAKAIHAGQNFWMMLQIKMQPGWHTYWKNPGDSGTPLALSWVLPSGFKTSEPQYLAPERESIGPLVDYGYSTVASYPVLVTPPAILRDNATSIFMLKAEWLVCKEICVPEKAELSLAMPTTSKERAEPGQDAGVVAAAVDRLPLPLPDAIGFSLENGEIHFQIANKELPFAEVASAAFFPAGDGLIANTAEQKVTPAADSVSFAIGKADNEPPVQMQGVVSLFLKSGARKDYEITLKSGGPIAKSGSAEGPGVLNAMLLALLGGLLLNLMPCVFPILSLKALAIAKKASAKPAIVRAQGLAYAAGVVLSFLAMAGLLIGLQQITGRTLGWGFQMQSPVFLAGLAIVLSAVGLNLSGYFDLPVLLGNFGGEAAAKDSAAGSFFTGALAVLVATPCTAPFMAPAIGFALTQPVPVILAVFASLGVGLASPFLFLSAFPILAELLPRPGAWMNTFKKLLAYPMYIATAWVLWVLAREAGADAVGITLLGIIFIALALWMWESESSLLRFLGLLLAIGTIAITAGVVHASHAMMQKPKEGEAFSPARLEELRKDGKAVFVDATADWCITCKVNEAVALSSPEVAQEFEQRHITLLTADWTHEDADITAYLASFGRRGVPLYVYYPPNNGAPVVLPQLLTRGIVRSALK